jgi:hypothetical protein
VNLRPKRGRAVKVNDEYGQFADFTDEQILHTGIVGAV